MTEPSIYSRRPDLTPPEHLVDDADPVGVTLQRLTLQVDLWEAVRQYEQGQRRLDAEAAALIARHEADATGPGSIHGLDTTALDLAELAAIHTEQDRRRRVTLWAEQRGLRHQVETSTDAEGVTRTRHLLTAPAGHPDLATPPWHASRPAIVQGQHLVQTVPADTLAAVETWLGLPHDPTADGTPAPTPHPATTGAAQP